MFYMCNFLQEINWPGINNNNRCLLTLLDHISSSNYKACALVWSKYTLILDGYYGTKIKDMFEKTL